MQENVLLFTDEIQNNQLFKIHEDRITIPRLKSRLPFLARVESLKDHERLHPDARKEDRESDISTNELLVDNERNKQSDFPRIL